MGLRNSSTLLAFAIFAAPIAVATSSKSRSRSSVATAAGTRSTSSSICARRNLCLAFRVAPHRFSDTPRAAACAKGACQADGSSPTLACVAYFTSPRT